MKKYLLWGLVLALVIVPTAWAQTTMTQEELMAEISRLTALLSQLQNATTTQTATTTVPQSCVTLNGSLGAVVPSNTLECCSGLVPYIQNPDEVGTRGICVQPTNTSITILTPKENETYDVGDKLKIKWTPRKALIKQIALICSGTCSSDYLVYQPRSSWFRTSSGVRNYRIPRSGFQPGYYRVRITLNDGTIAESSIIRILGEDEEEEEDDDDNNPVATTTRTPLTRDQVRPSPFPATQQPSEAMQTPETGSVCALGVNNSGWGSGSSQSTRDYCSSAKAGGWAVRCLKGPSLRAYQVPISSQGRSGDQVCASSGGVCTEVNSGPWGQKYCDDTADTYGWSVRCVIGSDLSAFSTNNEAGQSGDEACSARSAKCVSVNNNLWGHKYCYEANPEAGWSVRCVVGDGLSAADANTSSAQPSGDQVCAARVAQNTSVKQTASVWQAIRGFFLGR